VASVLEFKPVLAMMPFTVNYFEILMLILLFYRKEEGQFYPDISLYERTAGVEMASFNALLGFARPTTKTSGLRDVARSEKKGSWSVGKPGPVA
jgi:hypothetical protein